MGRKVFDRLRREVVFVEEDMYLAPLMAKSRELVRSGEVLRVVGSSVK